MPAPSLGRSVDPDASTRARPGPVFVDIEGCAENVLPVQGAEVEVHVGVVEVNTAVPGADEIFGLAGEVADVIGCDVRIVFRGIDRDGGRRIDGDRIRPCGIIQPGAVESDLDSRPALVGNHAVGHPQ